MTYRPVSYNLDNEHHDDGSNGHTDHQPAKTLNPVLKHVTAIAGLGVLNAPDDDDKLKQTANKAVIKYNDINVRLDVINDMSCEDSTKKNKKKLTVSVSLPAKIQHNHHFES